MLFDFNLSNLQKTHDTNFNIAPRHTVIISKFLVAACMLIFTGLSRFCIGSGESPILK